VINPETCIDCGGVVQGVPGRCHFADTRDRAGRAGAFHQLNAELALVWPVIQPDLPSRWRKLKTGANQGDKRSNL